MAALPGTLGYTRYEKQSPHVDGYFVTAYQQYDVQTPLAGSRRGLLLASRDAMQRETQITYDTYDLLPEKVIDPAHLETEAQYNYRVLQPRQVIDPNGNRSVFAFSPLGLLQSTAVMGKEGEGVGDTPEQPGTRLEYDFLAFMNSPPDQRQPISVRTIRREHHATDLAIPLSKRDATLETVEYSDGFGRLLQTRTQAEDLTVGDDVFGNGVLPADQGDEAKTKAPVVGRRRSPNDLVTVVVSGWQIYDNKGRDGREV